MYHFCTFNPHFVAKVTVTEEEPLVFSFWPLLSRPPAVTPAWVSLHRLTSLQTSLLNDEKCFTVKIPLTRVKLKPASYICTADLRMTEH